MVEGAEDKGPEAVQRKTIREAVAEYLGQLGGRTREGVIEHFASKEAEKQVKMLVDGLDKLDGLENELRRIKPQPGGFNAANEPVGEPVFSKEQVEQRKKLAEQIEKLTGAINKADDAGDFDQLSKLVNNKG